MSKCPRAIDLRARVDACLPPDRTEFILTLSNLYWMWHNTYKGTAQGELNILTMGFQSWQEFVSCCHPLLQPLRSMNEGNISCSAWCRGAPGQSDDFVSFRRSGAADVNSDFQFSSPSSSVPTIIPGSAVTVKKKRKSAESHVYDKYCTMRVCRTHE